MWASLVVCASAAQAADCSTALAQLVLVKGTVELVRQGTSRLTVADVNAGLCAGDTVVVHQGAQAALLLSNATVVRLDQGTTVTLSPSAGTRPALLNVVSGAIYVISRTPRPFRVRTPFINANVEGTEFLVEARRPSKAVDDPLCGQESGVIAAGSDVDRITVFEGRVRATNDSETLALTLAAGESAVATPTTGPTRELVVRPRDAVTWTLYVPPVIDSSRSYPDAVLCAARLVSLGRLEEAKQRLEKALAESSALAGSRAGSANALLATIAVAENETERARRFAEQAVAQDPGAAEPWVALSYVQQASFQVEAALASVLKAVAISPNADRKARLAELQMATGNIDAALSSATEAVKLNPALARAQTVLGFVYLARIETHSAKEAFARSIQLDNTDPLPRLGLGLARIREGNLPAGREEIEVAAVLDTNDSLVRSYLGKAYFEERRDHLAETQFRMAEEFDPRDPTPWFYSAILLQSTNRPVEALRDLHTSIALNDNRAVYRSRLLLDDDKAARTTSLATTYAALGFDRLSIGESVKALSENLGNDSAHRQLASAYANQPRHDIAKASEALQAQIRQPLTLSPIDPEISTDNLGLLRGNGPSRLGQNEFNQLFSGDRNRLQADGIVGSRGTFGDQLVVSGLSGKLAYAASQLHYQTDGFRDNNVARKDAEDVFLQGQLTAHASLQLEVKRADFKLGQTYFPFDPLVVLPLTIKERSDLLRVNGHYDAGPSADWIFSANDERRIRRVDNFPDGSPVTETRAHTRSLEVQHLYRSERIQWIIGAQGLLEQDHLPIEAVDLAERSQTIYVYGLWRPEKTGLSVQLGSALERLKIENPFFSEQTARHRLSPKLGIVWSPSADTTVRVAAFSAVKRPFIASQTLEPTQIAGFNQFFTGFDALYGDSDGTVSKRVGVGIDQRLGAERYVGAEVSSRRLDVPSLAAGHDFRWKESGAHLYFYDAILGRRAFATRSWTFATSLEYEVERLERPQEDPGPEGVVHVTTQRLPLMLRAYRGDVTLSAGVTHLRQTGLLSAGNGLDSFATTTNAWLTDLSSEYHLPQRRGSIAIGVRNLFDRRLDLFQSDPFTPRDPLRRFVYAKVRVIY